MFLSNVWNGAQESRVAHYETSLAGSSGHRSIPIVHRWTTFNNLANAIDPLICQVNVLLVPLDPRHDSLKYFYRAVTNFKFYQTQEWTKFPGNTTVL